MLTVKAYAKINIVLEVLGRRSDGYHNIASIIQTIDMNDVLSFMPSRDIEIVCNKSELNSPDNLILKAANLLCEAGRCESGVTIHLQKKIPIAAGLGGGSSDAAATLIALNKLWGLNFPIDQLRHIASDIGFDVPFFLYGGTALVEGRGDWVTSLPSLLSLPIVLLRPDIKLLNKTRQLYDCLTPAQYTSGNLARLAVEQLQHNEEISPLSYFNVFESVAFNIFPLLEEYRQQFISAGAARIHLAGSGPTLFSVMSKQSDAEKVTERLLQAGLEAYLTRTLGKAEQDSLSDSTTAHVEEINYL